MHTVISLVGVEAQREAVDIPGGIGATPRAGDGREPEEDRSLLASLAEERSSRDIGPVLIRLKVAVCGRPSSMNYTIRSDTGQW